jgi:hypothetical protein
MKLFNGHLKYLFLVPIILMVGFALLYQNAFAEIGRQLSAGTALAAQLSDLEAMIIIQTGITFLINTAFIALLCYLGVIYKSRKGSKWREPR